MSKRLGRFARQNAIALLALFLALGGTSFAAANIVLPKNSVGTKQLKKNAVISSKIKNNSVTGADVKESSLGKVPSATNADHATGADSATTATNATNATHATNADSATNATTAANANQLGGLAPSAYQKAVRWVLLNADGTIAAQSGGVVVEKFGGGAGVYFVDFGSLVLNEPVAATIARTDAHFPPGEVSAVPCGGGTNAVSCASVTHNNHNTLLINVADTAGTQTDLPVYVMVFG